MVDRRAGIGQGMRYIEVGPEAGPELSGPTWETLLTSSGQLHGADFAAIASQDMPRALGMLTDLLTFTHVEDLPNTTDRVLGLVDWVNEEDCEKFFDAATRYLIDNPGVDF